MELRRKDTCSLKRCRASSCKGGLCATSASLLCGRTIQKAIAFPIMIHAHLYLNRCGCKYKFILYVICMSFKKDHCFQMR
jgi:hypothetical protein